MDHLSIFQEPMGSGINIWAIKQARSRITREKIILTLIKNVNVKASSIITIILTKASGGFIPFPMQKIELQRKNYSALRRKHQRAIRQASSKITLEKINTTRYKMSM